MAAPGVAARRISLQITLPQDIACLLTTGETLRAEPPEGFGPFPPVSAAGRFEAGDPAAAGASRFPLPSLGGLPRGTLVEVVGRRSSGRFALALAALAAATQAGESAALVDLGDQLDPQ